MPFSLHQRPELVGRLRGEVFDLLVVGGGITGAGIARDAALRGLKVALVERGDFASGTSSRSSKLIHGGLRYLEMGDFKLVFEAVRERQRLMRLAPHLARPQAFVLPVLDRSKHGMFVLDVGLTIYDVMAAFAGVMTHKALRAKGLRQLEPLLRAEGLHGGVRYHDAMTDDARLVLANLRGAVQAGAVPVSRMAFLGPEWKHGHLVAARLRDQWTGEALQVACKLVVAAAGPWTDELLGAWRGQPGASMRPSKGVHVVVPRARLPLSQAVTMTARDGRVVFALPWPDATVIGTTDTPYDGDLAEPPCTRDDAEYLLQTANDQFLVPDRPLEVADIVSTWAGIRPLVVSPDEGKRLAGAASGEHGKPDSEGGQASSYKTSREHLITTDPRGLVIIAGGKLTTYRTMAAETIDAAVALLPTERTTALRPCQTANLPLPGAEGMPAGKAPLAALEALLRESHGLEPALARQLAWQYGTEAEQVLAVCQAEPDGLQPVVDGLPVRWGELAWLTQHEMVLGLTDLLVRRTQLQYLAGERLRPLLPALGQRLCGWLGLPVTRADEMVTEMAAYLDARRVGADAAT
jgi:glycerol-3-phosphate dehydrogenase